MDPITLAMVTAGMAGVGVIGQTISSVKQANTQSQFAKAETQSAVQSAAAEESASRYRSERILSKQAAIGAASGLDISSGSPLEVMLDSAKQAELEAQNIRYGGQLRRQSKLMESTLAKQQIPGIAFGGLAKGGSVFADLYSKQVNPTYLGSGGRISGGNP